MQTQRMDLRTWGGGRVSWDEVREWHGIVYTTKGKIDSRQEAAAQHREISSVLCVHLEGWDMEAGRETQEGGDMGIYVYVQLIQFVIQQKVTHHCKAIILQKKMLKKKKRSLGKIKRKFSYFSILQCDLEIHPHQCIEVLTFPFLFIFFFFRKISKDLHWPRLVCSLACIL